MQAPLSTSRRIVGIIKAHGQEGRMEKTYPARLKDGTIVHVTIPETDRTLEEVADFLQQCVTGNRFKWQADAEKAIALLARLET